MLALPLLLFLVGAISTTHGQCPGQLPADSTCSDSSWIVNQPAFVLATDLDISLAAVNFSGSYLQYPNATLTLSWNGDQYGTVSVADGALISGGLLVRFTARPKNGLKLVILNAGTVTGSFQVLTVDKNYTSSACDRVTLEAATSDTPPAAITVSVSKSSLCKTERHIALIVVSVLCGAVMLAVIGYLCVTEPRLCRRFFRK